MRPPSLRTRSIALTVSGALLCTAAAGVVASAEAMERSAGAAAPATVVSNLRTSSICHGGGRILLTVSRVDDTFVLSAAARGLPSGSRWHGGFGVENETEQ